MQPGDRLIWRHRVSNYGHMDHTPVTVKHITDRRVTVRSEVFRGGPRLHSVAAGSLAPNWCERMGISRDQWCRDCQAQETQ